MLKYVITNKDGHRWEPTVPPLTVDSIAKKIESGQFGAPGEFTVEIIDLDKDAAYLKEKKDAAIRQAKAHAMDTLSQRYDLFDILTAIIQKDGNQERFNSIKSFIGEINSELQTNIEKIRACSTVAQIEQHISSSVNKK